MRMRANKQKFPQLPPDGVGFKRAESWWLREAGSAFWPRPSLTGILADADGSVQAHATHQGERGRAGERGGDARRVRRRRLRPPPSFQQ